MKLNKSILGFVLISIFILSSCSQARYGSHTRRVKGSKIVQQDKRVDRIQRASGILTPSVASEDVYEETSEIVVAQKEEIHTVIEQSFAQEMVKEKTVKAPKSTKPLTMNAKNQLKKTRPIKNIKTIQKKIAASAAKTDGEIGDVLYIVLVVILILLILNLITKLIPALSWLLGLAVLVLLIYLLLQIL